MYPLLLITAILIGGGFDLAAILGATAAAEAPAPSPFAVHHNGSRADERGPHQRRYREPRDFCGRSVTKTNFCPDPRTFQDFDAAQYQGLWYEIGTLAKFKFEHELGQVCEHSLNSLLVPRHGDHGAVMAVVRRGQQVLTPGQKMGVLRLASAAHEVCMGARGVCDMVVEHGPYDSTLVAMRTAVAAIRRSHPDLPQLSSLGEATRHMEELERLVVQQMDKLAADVARLQALNANISQQVGHVEINIDNLMERSSAVDELVRSLSLRISETTDNVRAEVSRDAALLRPENLALAVRLEASVLTMDAQLVKVQAKLQQISAFLARITTSARAFWAAEPPEVGMPGPAQPMTEVRGIAVQNPDALGKFQLHQYRSTASYWVLDVEGNANNTRYEALIIYSCVENLDGTPPQENLMVLSRNRTLDHDVFQRFMRTAKRNHIYLDCENVFIYASQNHGTCSSWPYA